MKAIPEGAVRGWSAQIARIAKIHSRESRKCDNCHGRASVVHLHIGNTHIGLGLRDVKAYWCDDCKAFSIDEFDLNLRTANVPLNTENPMVIQYQKGIGCADLVDLSFFNSPYILLNATLTPSGAIMVPESHRNITRPIAIEHILNGSDKIAPSANYGSLNGPQILKLETTTFCNLKCSFCNNPALTSRDHVRLEKFRVTWDSLPKSNLRQISFTGLGEAMLNKSLWDMVEIVSTPGADISLVTNGMLLEKYAEQISQSGITKLAVSLETVRPELYEKGRSGATLEKLISAIDHYIEVRERNGRGPSLGVVCVVTTSTVNFVGEVVDFCLRRGLELPSIYPAYDLEEAGSTSEAAELVHRLEEQFDAIRARGFKLRSSRELFHLRLHELGIYDRQLQLCGEPNTVLVCHADGTFSYCNQGIFSDNRAPDTGATSRNPWESDVAQSYRFSLYYGRGMQNCINCSAMNFPVPLASEGSNYG